ncbi:MAG: DUF488 domain-containing protein [Nitrospirales bacterium]|nr:DUF488 domain-containing protein [Nitrospirales bacterium]
MEVYTIGFTKRKADEFFGALKQAVIKRLLDVRLNNSSQLAGFTKSDNLPFFLMEICAADYLHEPLLAPTKDILYAYKKRKGRWEDYEKSFMKLMAERRIEDKIDRRLFATPTVLLCSEAKADCCHRRLVLEYLQTKWNDLQVVHL